MDRDINPRDRDRTVAAGLALTATTVFLVALALLATGTVQMVSIAALGLLVLIVAIATAAIERHRVARRVAALEKELQSERDSSLEVNGQFARFADELQTPLTAVLGLSRHLENARVSDVAEAEELIDLISRDATEIVRAVETTAAGVQIDAGTYRPKPAVVQLDRHVTRIVEAMGHSALEIAVDVREAPVWCDPAAVRLVLLNILHTAHDGGANTVRIDVDERNGLGILSTTDDRERGHVVGTPPGDLLGKGDTLSRGIVPALVDSQGGTMSSSRTLGWSNTIVRLPLATLAQLSATSRTTPTIESSRTA